MVGQPLSPKDLAEVIGVSESSLKRWVDEGRLRAERTAGGHRRIALHEAVRFIRATSQSVRRPEPLGIAFLGVEALGAVESGAGEHALLSALRAGDAQAARGLMLAQHLASRSIASVCDGPIAYAMHRIGELWRHDPEGIAIERRATQIVLETLQQVRATLPPAGSDAPLALGASASGDPYQLPGVMAATTLLEAGFQDMNLGADVSVDALIGAIGRHRPRLVWMSASVIDDAPRFAADISRIGGAARGVGATLVLGGRGMMAIAPPALPSTHVVASMSELGALGRGLLAQWAGREQG